MKLIVNLLFCRANRQQLVSENIKVRLGGEDEGFNYLLY
jgi:hypothetical protein